MGSARGIGLPKSYRFNPIDEELIIHYLYNRVHGKPLPSNIVIDCNLYDEKEPWREVFKESKENIHYFFTKLKKKSEKGSRIERGTRCSTWRSQRDQKIYFHATDKKTHIGSKRNFSYVPKEGFKANGRWVMHEYRLDGFLLNNNTHHDEYVLCRVKKEKSKEEEEQQQEESITNSDINKRVPETESSESGLKQMEQLPVIPRTPGVQKMEEEWMESKNTTDSLSDFKQDFDSFEEDPNLGLTAEESSIFHSSDESSPNYQATQTMSSLMERSCLRQASVVSLEVSTNYMPVPESTYQLPTGSNEFSIPSTDNKRMWNYQQQQQPVPMNVVETGVQTQGQASVVPPASTYMLPSGSNKFAIPSAGTEHMCYYQQQAVQMNESFWGIPNSQKDNWLQGLNLALDDFSHEPVSKNF